MAKIRFNTDIKKSEIPDFKAGDTYIVGGLKYLITEVTDKMVIAKLNMITKKFPKTMIGGKFVALSYGNVLFSAR